MSGTWVSRFQLCEKMGGSVVTCCEEGNVLLHETSGALTVLQRWKWPKRQMYPLKNKTDWHKYANMLMCNNHKKSSGITRTLMLSHMGWGPLLLWHDLHHLGIPSLNKNNQITCKSNQTSPSKQQTNNRVGGGQTMRGTCTLGRSHLCGTF